MKKNIGTMLIVAAAAGLFVLAIPQLSPAAGTGKKRLQRLPRTSVRTTNTLMDAYIKSIATAVKGSQGRWTFKFNKVDMMVITDQKADRMRVMAPITSAKKLSRADMLKMMEANFDRALDAKYAIFNDTVWAVYVHPLGSLGKEELRSAIAQVAKLLHTYGSTYTSTDMVFGG